MSDLSEKMNELCARMGKTTAGYIEEMAAAYYQKTNIPPDEVVLVQELEPGTYRYKWYFRRRTAQDTISG